MEELVKNALFQLSGWIFTTIGAIIAIYQLFVNKKLKRTINEKDIIISNLNIQVNSFTRTDNRKIDQGGKSQYIETSNAPININIGQ